MGGAYVLTALRVMPAVAKDILAHIQHLLNITDIMLSEHQSGRPYLNFQDTHAIEAVKSS